MGIITFFTILSSVFFSASSVEPVEIELSNGEVVEVILLNENDGYQYEVNFENGHQYVHGQSGDFGSGYTDDSITGEEMLLAQEAIDLYEKQHGVPKSSSESSSKIIGVVLILVGMILTAVPYIAWYLQIGWRLRDAEPSSLALAANRIGGVALLFIGVIFLIS